VKASGRRQLARARLEFGIDVNGRFDLDAFDSLLTYHPDGRLDAVEEIPSVVGARRTGTGAYVQAETAAIPVLRAAAGLRVDRVTTRSGGGYFGRHQTSNAAVSGFGSMTAGPFSGFSLTGQVARGFRDPTLS